LDRIDRIIFGDNQFFGINHMSVEKARQLAEKFYDLGNIFSVYDAAFGAGVKAVMLNSNDRAGEICDCFRKHKERYRDIVFYPSIPYPHKYANLVAEKGVFSAIGEILFRDNSALDVLGIISKGGMAVLGKDSVKMMQLLVDTEMKIFKGLRIKAVFLQNIITDLILGFGMKEMFYEYCKYIRGKYAALPGLITQNLPYLLNKLREWDIREAVICSSFNKIGYLMSPGVKSYIDAAKNNDPQDYQLAAMATLASGAIPAREAYEFINQQNIQSVVFGASGKAHIEETVSLIKL
jgi:hypothetical protein